MTYMFVWYWIIIGLYLILVAATSKYKLVVFTAPPVILLLIISTIMWEYNMLNEPIHRRPVGEYVYQHHKIYRTNDKMYLYAWLSDNQNRERIYFFEYNKQDEGIMRKAKQKSTGKDAREQKLVFRHNGPLTDQDLTDRTIKGETKTD